MYKTTLICIWKKSIYENKFRCNVCDTELMDSDFVPHKDLLVEGKYILCPKCHQLCGKIETVDIDENVTGKLGNYEDYLKGKMN